MNKFHKNEYSKFCLSRNHYLKKQRLSHKYHINVTDFCSRGYPDQDPVLGTISRPQNLCVILQKTADRILKKLYQHPDTIDHGSK